MGPMRHAAVTIAAVVVLAGCGADDGGATAEGSATPSPSEVSSASSSPSPAKDEKPKKAEPTEDEPKAAVPDDAPACASVWRTGTRLARTYEGCMSGATFVAVDQEPCSFGQRLVRYGDHFYAVRGGPVNRTDAPLLKDRDYRGAIASCRA